VAITIRVPLSSTSQTSEPWMICQRPNTPSLLKTPPTMWTTLGYSVIWFWWHVILHGLYSDQCLFPSLSPLWPPHVYSLFFLYLVTHWVGWSLKHTVIYFSLFLFYRKLVFSFLPHYVCHLTFFPSLFTKILFFFDFFASSFIAWRIFLFPSSDSLQFWFWRVNLLGWC
jgi:hypothetical protein